jgi:HSP20 family molecular chaperone IbpA
MSTVTRRDNRTFLDLFDWLESPMAVFRPRSGQGIRMEHFVQDGHYIVRAELPGVDPEHEVEVFVDDGILSIKAERKEEQVDKAHSEFRYGIFSRRIVLPPGADESHISASYDKGILEIVVDLKEGEPKTPKKRITIKQVKPVKAG